MNASNISCFIGIFYHVVSHFYYVVYGFIAPRQNKLNLVWQCFHEKGLRTSSWTLTPARAFISRSNWLTFFSPRGRSASSLQTVLSEDSVYSAIRCFIQRLILISLGIDMLNVICINIPKFKNSLHLAEPTDGIFFAKGATMGGL